MVEESKAAPAAGAKQISSMLPLVLVAGVVYLSSTVGFSYLFGAFDSPPANVAVEATTESDSGGAEDTIHNQSTTLAEASEQPDSDGHEAYQEGIDGVVDSVAAVEWIERERIDLKQQREAIETQKQELTSLKSDIEKLLAKVQEAKSERFVMMAKLYDSMDPAAAAKQISNMDDRNVVMLLPQMNRRTAAKVMALLDPQRAAKITTKLLAMD